MGILDQTCRRIADDHVMLGELLDSDLTSGNIPRSQGLERAIALMPIQDKISLLHRSLAVTTSQKELEEEYRLALEVCSAALARADRLVERFLRAPLKTTPAEFQSAALALESALAQLRRTHDC